MPLLRSKLSKSQRKPIQNPKIELGLDYMSAFMVRYCYFVRICVRYCYYFFYNYYNNCYYYYYLGSGSRLRLGYG